MPRATISFKLPEEELEFKQASQAGSAYCAMWDVGQELFRPARKHGYSDARIQNLLTKLDDMVRNAAIAAGATEEDFFNGKVEAEDATDLIRMLEERFYSILDSYNVSLEG